MFEESPLKKTIINLINIGSWVILGLSILLATIVAIAQSALPGMSTYKIKTGFEIAVLTGFKLMGQDSRYQIDLTKLRFEETQKIISSSKASLGLNNLNQQIISTEDSIKNISDPGQKSAMVNQYINTLTSINEQLEQDKTTTITNQNSPTLIPSIASPNSSNNEPATISNQQTTVDEEINQTQQQIQETINNLNEQNSQPTSIPPTITPKHDNNSENNENEQDKEEKEKDKEKEKEKEKENKDKNLTPSPVHK